MPRKKADKNPKFIQCPKCFGPIDYFNTCRLCGRTWTPELTETEKKEQADKEAQAPEEEELDPVGPHEPEIKRTEEELEGKVARKVGDSAKSVLPKRTKLWQVQDDDTETEISRKRSLMRVDSRKTYNAMGLAVRAYENQRAVLLSLTRLWEFLEDDERDSFNETADSLKRALVELAKFRKTKIDAATAMEREISKEHNKARQVRFAREKRVDPKKTATRLTTPGADSEGFETVPGVQIDPELLMQQVKDRLSLRDKAPVNEDLTDEDSEV